MLSRGKRTKEWEEQRKKLKELYFSKGITSCELHLDGCWGNNALSFAHRHKRSWYYGNEELLGDFNQTLLVCIPCHNKIEFNKELTEELFNKLRGE